MYLLERYLSYDHMLYWDEENRLMVLKDNNGINRYTYNAAGERIMKSYGTMEGVVISTEHHKASRSMRPTTSHFILQVSSL